MRHRYVAVLSVAALAACGSLSDETARLAPTPPNLRLKHGSDEDILRQIGFDPAKMKASRAEGPDGYGTHYKAPNGEWVGITRSASTGVFVMYGDSTGQKGNWTLGFPPRRKT